MRKFLGPGITVTMTAATTVWEVFWPISG